MTWASNAWECVHDTRSSARLPSTDRIVPATVVRDVGHASATATRVHQAEADATDETSDAPLIGAGFLSGLSESLRQQILDSATTTRVGAGAAIFPPRAEWTRAGVVESGVARAYIGAGDGRMLTVRYARPGELIGSVFPLVGDRAPLGISAVTDCTVVEFNIRHLREIIETDASAATQVVHALSQRLEDSYASLAAHAFGTMRERVAGHLLDLAHPTDEPQRLTVPVTQQQLADGVGTVREVVARVLRELRSEGIVTTSAGSIVILDPVTLASQVGRWNYPTDT